MLRLVGWEGSELFGGCFVVFWVGVVVRVSFRGRWFIDGVFFRCVCRGNGNVFRFCMEEFKDFRNRFFIIIN